MSSIGSTNLRAESSSEEAHARVEFYLRKDSTEQLKIPDRIERNVSMKKDFIRNKCKCIVVAYASPVIRGTTAGATPISRYEECMMAIYRHERDQRQRRCQRAMLTRTCSR
ncbi:uncharacterized protein PHALS_10553 [Plasmopara halstedii]|uniref:Uncharacterized protein n=1 Tax=Plasmopara halstedii TaxID=4781 RepID=A0A0P1AHN1_PLAHL|nr:uncharacterized protein PHALS_10553 [Plasmopara halstedii]CEG40349.1 hypothetical protein PHALS_10553 [Plasmopara halstedii]|eukprot:XP_024576718.1 hypothetical protein PHALS_10553 [Plasmopara halstedii]